MSIYRAFLCLKVLLQKNALSRKLRSAKKARAWVGCCQRTTARKTPAISTRKCSCQKLAHPCPTLGQLLASRILYKPVLGENSTKTPKQDFVHRVAQKLANSWSTPRQLPTPWEVAGVFLAVVLRQHPNGEFQGHLAGQLFVSRQFSSRGTAARNGFVPGPQDWYKPKWSSKWISWARVSVEILRKPQSSWNFPAHPDSGTFAAFGRMTLICWGMLRDYDSGPEFPQKNIPEPNSQVSGQRVFVYFEIHRRVWKNLPKIQQKIRLKKGILLSVMVCFGSNDTYTTTPGITWQLEPSKRAFLGIVMWCGGWPAGRAPRTCNDFVFFFHLVTLVARYSAILRYCSCYTPYNAIPFRGQLDVRYPPPLFCFACKQNVNAIGVYMGGIAR